MTAASTTPAGSALSGAGGGVALLLVLLGVLGMHVMSGGGTAAGHQFAPPGWTVHQAVGELLAVPHQLDQNRRSDPRQPQVILLANF
jgi:hypothetical protein